MQRRPPTDINDYWEIILRRLWWIVIPTLLISSMMTVVSVRLPRFYRSETLVLVDPQKVPTEYVSNSIGGGVAERLQKISQEILSRTRLQKVIDQFGLYKDKKKLSQEDIVDLMRRDIGIQIVTDRQEGTRSLGGFKITYTGNDPAQVQQVNRQLASLFIEENLKFRQEQASGTDSFIERELDKARESLELQEAKMKNFKSKYMGSLPEQQTANLQMIGQFQTMLQANSDAMSRLQQQKVYLETMSDSFRKTAFPSPARSDLQVNLATRRAELAVAEQRYQANHPDLIRLREEIKALEAQNKNAASPVSAQADDPGQVDQVKIQLTQLNMELKSRSQRQGEIEARIRSLQSKIDLLPAIEQQFSELNRDYQSSKTHYESLLAKKNNSSMAADVEHQAQGEQFRVVDPASLPAKPFKPNLLMLNFGGLIAGLVLGVGLGAVQEFRDSSIHNDKDATFYLPVALLGTIPEVVNSETTKLRKQKSRRNWMLSSATAMIVIAIAVYLFLHRSAFAIAG
jgi:polysaccharide chain length determinant protein (PEP-CTERM system associated)